MVKKYFAEISGEFVFGVEGIDELEAIGCGLQADSEEGLGRVELFVDVLEVGVEVGVLGELTQVFQQLVDLLLTY